MRVVLGNRDAVQQVRTVVDGEVVEHSEDMPRAKRATAADIADGTTLTTALTALTHPTQGVWAKHAAPGATPAWVASDNPSLAAVLADHFGGVEIRELETEGNA